MTNNKQTTAHQWRFARAVGLARQTPLRRYESAATLAQLHGILRTALNRPIVGNIDINKRTTTHIGTDYADCVHATKIPDARPRRCCTPSTKPLGIVAGYPPRTGGFCLIRI